MKSIKFSHVYDKMLNNPHQEPPKTAILMECFRARSEELHPRFVEYDTMYYDKQAHDMAYYKLPAGEVIILLLKSGMMVWTTIRRYTPEKWEYYRRSRWEEFKVEITEVLE